METVLIFFARFALYARFVVIGSAGALVQTGVLDYMTRVLGRWYMEGVVVGFVLSVFVMFVIEKYWVFHDRSRNHTRRELFFFFLVSIAGLGETMLFMYVLVEIFQLYHLIAQLVTTFVVLSTTYPLNQRITFRKRR